MAYFDSSDSLEKMVNSFHTKLAGVTHSNEGTNTENRQAIIRDLYGKGLLRRGQELLLRPEPTNRFDHQAVAVFGPDRRQLGYLPKEVAHRIFLKLESTSCYSAFVEEVTGGGTYAYGVNVRIEEYQSEQKSYADIERNAADLFSIAMGYHKEKIYGKAFDAFRQSAESGIVEAQFMLGVYYDEGLVTSSDSKLASYWYLQAAEQGHAEAQCNIAINYIEGYGMDIDYQKALYWVKKSMAQGFPNAYNVMGQTYEKGRGVTRGFQKSYEYYLKAAELGNEDGAANVAIAYLIGRGVERDPYEAARWNTFAAERNQNVAQFNLARQYLTGDGVPQDQEVAIYWINEAAKNGHPQAVGIVQSVFGK